MIADEPTTALDVSIQAQVLNLFMDLQEEFNTAYVFISHNLAVVEHAADDLMVMYLGRAVEVGAKEKIYSRPLHPYTQALLSATPSIHPEDRRIKIKITGELPSPLNPPTGCAFHKRCPLATPRCAEEAPVLRPAAFEAAASTALRRWACAASSSTRPIGAWKWSPPFPPAAAWRPSAPISRLKTDSTTPNSA